MDNVRFMALGAHPKRRSYTYMEGFGVSGGAIFDTMDEALEAAKAQRCHDAQNIEPEHTLLYRVVGVRKSITVQEFVRV